MANKTTKPAAKAAKTKPAAKAPKTDCKVGSPCPKVKK